MNSPAPRGSHHDRAPIILLCALFAAMTIPLSLAGYHGPSEAVDQERYHWPTVLALREHWPTVSLEDYRTATGPLYHEVLALVTLTTGTAQWPIRLINAICALPLVIAVFLLVRRRAGPWLAGLLVMPFVLSAYPLSSAIWITTDNVALLFVVLALLTATCAGNATKRTIGASVYAALATAVRQIHLWVVAPCALANFLRLRNEERAGWLRAGLRSMPIMLPACIVVLLLVWWWGGLTPPYVEPRNAATSNPFAFGFAMSLIGLFGVFYLPIVQPLKDRAMWRGVALPVIMLASLALTVLTPTTLDKSAGRWGGPIWAVVDHLPVVMERSIVFPPLAMLGGLFLLAACRRAASLGRSNEALVALAAIVCFTVANAVQPWSSQRYFEPVLLVLVMWLASLSVEPAKNANAAPHTTPRMVAGPAMLALIQLVLTGYAVYWQAIAAEIQS